MNPRNNSYRSVKASTTSGGSGGSPTSVIRSLLGYFPGLAITTVGIIKRTIPEDITIFKIYANSTTEVTSNVTLTLNKNGIFLASIVILSGTNSTSSGVLSLPVTTSDYLTLDITNPGGARDVLVRIDY